MTDDHFTETDLISASKGLHALMIHVRKADIIAHNILTTNKENQLEKSHKILRYTQILLLDHLTAIKINVFYSHTHARIPQLFNEATNQHVHQRMQALYFEIPCLTLEITSKNRHAVTSHELIQMYLTDMRMRRKLKFPTDQHHNMCSYACRHFFPKSIRKSLRLLRKT